MLGVGLIMGPWAAGDFEPKRKEIGNVMNPKDPSFKNDMESFWLVLLDLTPSVGSAFSCLEWCGVARVCIQEMLQDVARTFLFLKRWSLQKRCRESPKQSMCMRQAAPKASRHHYSRPCICLPEFFETKTEELYRGAYCLMYSATLNLCFPDLSIPPRLWHQGQILFHENNNLSGLVKTGFNSMPGSTVFELS